jgi:hypothetical protein
MNFLNTSIEKIVDAAFVQHRGQRAHDRAEQSGEHESDDAHALRQDVAEQLRQRRVVFEGDHLLGGRRTSGGNGSVPDLPVERLDLLGQSGIHRGPRLVLGHEYGELA